MSRVAIIAGESSGDQLGAALIRSLHAINPDIDFVGMAGPKMVAAGCRPIARAEELSVMGIVEVLKQYPRLRRLRERLVDELLAANIDLLVGIDVPDFVLTIERRLKQSGVVTVHYVAPQVWAWRSERARKLSNATDLLMTLFPFEPEFFSRHGVNAAFVGHPLVKAIPPHVDRGANKTALGLDPSKPYVALMPGSRRQELKRHVDLFLRTAERIAERFPEHGFLCGAVDDRAREFITERREALALEPLIDVTVGRSHETLMASDAALAVSGTVTMEAVCAQTPLVVAIRVAEISYRILRRMIEVPYVAMPNVLAGERLVPEFVQHEATPDVLADAVCQWISNEHRTAAYRRRCRELRDMLTVDSEHDAAAAVNGLLSLRATHQRDRPSGACRER